MQQTIAALAILDWPRDGTTGRTLRRKVVRVNNWIAVSSD